MLETLSKASLPTPQLIVIWGVEVPNRLFAPSLLTSNSSIHPTRSVSASSLIQDTRASSIEKSIPLSDFMAVWQVLQNVSQWVLNMVRKGYRIQFAFRPPQFNGIVAKVVCVIRISLFQPGTTVSPGERGHRECTPPREGFRVLQLVLYCAQKRTGIASDFRSEGPELHSSDTGSRW